MIRSNRSNSNPVIGARFTAMKLMMLVGGLYFIFHGIYMMVTNPSWEDFLGIIIGIVIVFFLLIILGSQIQEQNKNKIINKKKGEIITIEVNFEKCEKCPNKNCFLYVLKEMHDIFKIPFPKYIRIKGNTIIF